MRTLILLSALLLTGCVTTQNFVETAAITKSKIGFEEFTTFNTASSQKVDHSALDRFLQTYLVSSSANNSATQGANLFRYAEVSQADHDALNTYIAKLEGIRASDLNRDEQLAFWINLYNAKTISVIVENYPTESIRAIKSNFLDFKGPWNDKSLTVEGVDLSLDNIENKIIRPVFNDARIHYAVNCAAIGCPNLREKAYQSDTLDTALEEQARAYINNPRGVFIKNDQVTASRIFLWYKGDFGENENEVLNHIRSYASPTLRQSLEGIEDIHRFEYDWSLNDAASQTN